MDSLEAWLEFRRGEAYQAPKPTCWHCGEPCSGDTTETFQVDGTVGEVPVCDEPEKCSFLNQEPLKDSLHPEGF